LSYLMDLGEKSVIEKIISRYLSKPGYGEYLDYPNDARDIIPIAPRILFSIDGYALDKVKLPWRTMRDLGYTAVVGAISDHVCKGGIPRDIVISLGLPRDMKIDDLVELLEGVREAIEQYKLRYIGGDLNESPTPWIDIAVISYTSVKKPPSRCCVKVGDKIIVTGVYGAMGYVAIHGLNEASKQKWVVEATRRPRLYLETAFIIGKYYRSINASMDVSDGLGYTLLELSKLSGYGIALRNHPVYHSELNEICYDAFCKWRYVLNGGEEYGVVLSIDSKWVDKVARDLEMYNVPFSIIGEVVNMEPGLYIDGKHVEDLVITWDQFKGWG